MTWMIRLVTLFLLVPAAGIGSAAADELRPVYTNKPRFRIPYRYDAAEMEKMGARQVQLYLSVDEGRNWQRAQSVEPDAGKFDFQAPDDGEYWFAVRILDGQNRLHPVEIEPGLKVVVDTMPPTLEISLRQAAPGLVELSWKASDLHLDPIKLRMEYVESGGQNWRQIGVVPSAEGTTSWAAPNGGVVAVRATISDLAQNVSRTQKQIRIEPGDGKHPGPVPDFRQPIARGFTAPNLVNDAANLRPGVVQGRYPQPGAAVPPNSPLPAIRPAPSISPSSNSPAPSINPSSNSPSSNSPSSSGPGGNRAGAGNERNTNAPAGSSHRPIRAERRRAINTRKFQIAYKVDDVGPSGISSVEMYITTDDGRRWWKYGTDPDQTSPFDVEVSQDGVYGFALRVLSGVGFAADPPQPGERPTIVVVVDQTPPAVALLPVEQGEGPRSNKLLIRWRIADDHPAEKPIALSYSAGPNGPWKPIGDWREDTGSYLWAVERDAPPKFYIRVTARDAAGNIAHAQTPEPVVVDLNKPTARIVDVEGNGGNGK